MKKLVNIDSPAILYVLTPPLKGVINKIEMDVKNIRYCLTKGAKVEEILADGSVVRLDLDNYNKVTELKSVAKPKNKPVEKKVEPAKTEPLKQEVIPEQPVVEKTEVTEEEVEILEGKDIEAEPVEEKTKQNFNQKGNKNNSKKKY